MWKRRNKRKGRLLVASVNFLAVESSVPAGAGSCYLHLFSNTRPIWRRRVGLCGCCILHLFSAQCKGCAQFSLWCYEYPQNAASWGAKLGTTGLRVIWCTVKLDFKSPFHCDCCLFAVCRWVMILLMSGFTNKKTKPKETRKQEKEEILLEFIFFPPSPE